MNYFAILALVAIGAVISGLTGAAVGRVVAWVLRVDGLTFRKLFAAAWIGSVLAVGGLVLAGFVVLDPQRVTLTRVSGLVLAAVTIGAAVMAGSRASQCLPPLIPRGGQCLPPLIPRGGQCLPLLIPRGGQWKRVTVGESVFLPICCLAGAFTLALGAGLVPFPWGIVGSGPRILDLPVASAATDAEIRDYERIFPDVLLRLTLADSAAMHGAFHGPNPLLEGRFWNTVRSLPVWDEGGEWLLEAIDRVYLAFHDNGYHGYSWHYPYFDCFKAVALAGKAYREYGDPAIRQEALWRQVYCYRVRGLVGDEHPDLEYDIARHPSASAQARWKSDLGRARELLAELVERFPNGKYRAEADALLRFGFGEIKRPVSFPSLRALSRQALRRCSGEELPSSSPERSPRCRRARGQAVGDLEQIGDRRAVPVLLQVVEEDKSAVEIDAGLKARQALEAGADDPDLRKADWRLGMWALRALEELDPPSAAIVQRIPARPADEISRLLEDVGVRIGANDELDRVVSTTPEAVGDLLRFLDPDLSRDSWLAESASRLLLSIELQTGEVLPRMVRRFAAGELDLDAFDVLVKDARRARRTLRLTVEAIDVADPEARARVAVLLGSLAQGQTHFFYRESRPSDVEAEAEARLRQLLEDPSAEVRRAVALQLGFLGRPPAPSTLPLLAGRIRDEDAGVRELVAQALGYAGQYTSELVAALGDSDAAVRTAAATALDGSGGDGAVAALTALIGDPVLEVQAAAISALGRLEEAAEPAVDRLAEVVLGDDPDLGLEALRAITSILGRGNARRSELSTSYYNRHGMRSYSRSWVEKRRAAERQADG